MIHIMHVYGKWQLADTVAVYLLIYEPQWASSTEVMVKEREDEKFCYATSHTECFRPHRRLSWIFHLIITCL